MKRAGTKIVVTAGLLLMSSGFVVAAGTPVDVRLLGPDHRGHGADGGRPGADRQPGHRGDHGRAAAGTRRAPARPSTTPPASWAARWAWPSSARCMSSAYGSHVAARAGPAGRAGGGRAPRPRGSRSWPGWTWPRHLPPGLREAAAAATRQAFMNGLHGRLAGRRGRHRGGGPGHAGLPAGPGQPPGRRTPSPPRPSTAGPARSAPPPGASPDRPGCPAASRSVAAAGQPRGRPVVNRKCGDRPGRGGEEWPAAAIAGRPGRRIS